MAGSVSVSGIFEPEKRKAGPEHRRFVQDVPVGRTEREHGVFLTVLPR